MPQYEFSVYETVVNEVIYTVVAETELEAFQKGTRGEIEKEEFHRQIGVINRAVQTFLGKPPNEIQP